MRREGLALKSDASCLETQVEQWKRNHATKLRMGCSPALT